MSALLTKRGRPSDGPDSLGPSAGQKSRQLEPDSEDGMLINTRWTPEQAIADRVPGRNHAQCLQRWNKVLKPGLIKGHWAADEDDLLIQLVQASTTVSWGELSKSIDGRTAKQCRERWKNHLDPSINKGSYSSEEDMLLTAAYAELGNRWTQIADRMPVCNPRHVPQLSFAPVQATPGGAFTDTPRHLHQRYPEDEPHFAHPHPDPSALDPDAADLMSRRASSMFESFKERDSSLLSFASVKAEDWEFFRELVLSDHFAQAMPAAPVEMVSIFDSFKDTSMTDAEFRQLVGVIENPDAIMDFIHETYASVNEDGGCPAYIPPQLLSDQLDTRLVLGDYERSPEVSRDGANKAVMYRF
ncbi:hypothetical protein DYB35_001559 [Aphanomyces astaci]|uniref:Myb-like domain-containing protein n=1 Tax=Aphanomyces astaci TaxID=112090 RepID=A0A418DUT8_APHAT|nr:hypothetical protein DYB35_001559 [Aphanomyces astaci]